MIFLLLGCVGISVSAVSNLGQKASSALVESSETVEPQLQGLIAQGKQIWTDFQNRSFDWGACQTQLPTLFSSLAGSDESIDSSKTQSPWARLLEQCFPLASSPEVSETI